MALNPIVYTEKVVSSFLRYQLAHRYTAVLRASHSLNRSLGSSVGSFNSPDS